ncbi:uncharacterized protein LOC143450502 [Clavelina lepadiformis]|uniref:uncharacterized protein LOC143450502 n=1 Tax=Clavelina lepadiformis TaxID=159417 RepID=UPI004043377D
MMNLAATAAILLSVSLFAKGQFEAVNLLIPFDRCPRGFSWTRWFDEDSPSDDTNDVELFTNIKNKFGICPDVTQAHITQVLQIASPWHVPPGPGEPVSSGPFGAVCFGPPCKDYKVRFCCKGRVPRPTGIIGSCPSGHWTGWLNRDRPTATGDWEVRKPFHSCVCGVNSPTAIQVQFLTRSGLWLPYEQSGNLIHIDPEAGFYCINRQQYPYPGSTRPECKDFRVRYCCPCPPARQVFGFAPPQQCRRSAFESAKPGLHEALTVSLKD